MTVMKVGATTKATVGEIVQLDKAGVTETGTFMNHILVRSLRQNYLFSSHGDYGSVVTYYDPDKEKRFVVGMVRSGNGPYTIVTPWEEIEKHCDLTLLGNATSS